MPATPSESSLSELDSSLSALSLLSDSDNEPLINRHPVHPQPPEERMKATSVPHSDSDDEPLIKRRTAQPLPLEPTQATLVDSDDEPLIKRRTAQPLPLEPTQATLVDSDNEPLIKRRTAQPLPLEPTQATLVDSDDEPLINRHPVAGKSSVRNIPAKKKRIRKKTSYVLQSYAQLAKTSILCFC
ncbi:hypothetical protein PtA15_10A132 [Puccinia triticina]|uniref:Shugoshin C-terminal domain-containing protein n=1 Tax=Puccinia triticina TaxID=208348 RepID=A0ABY7CUW9_9BASI|nr:uncharacterized protein PtA15_10A132 [Puccinia triticina]WAQ88713.1 hypothetical protein PtA15_10A132 [Puccinia triticina]